MPTRSPKRQVMLLRVVPYELYNMQFIGNPYYKFSRPGTVTMMKRQNMKKRILKSFLTTNRYHRRQFFKSLRYIYYDGDPRKRLQHSTTPWKL